MFLRTNLKHIASAEDLEKTIKENENLMICCGRMGPMCLPVYDIMEELEDDENYKHIAMYDMLFDNPGAAFIRNHPACLGFTGLPFTLYFKNGKVVKATSSIQNMNQVTAILDFNFPK